MNAGYVYVIAFSNGTVKVGRGQDAVRRIAAHKGDARKFGHTITGSWTSPLHLEWYANENTLKKLAVKFGGTVHRAEYFTGTDFAAIVAEAETLPFTPPAFTPPVPADDRRAADPKAALRAELWETLRTVAAVRVPGSEPTDEERALVDQLLAASPPSTPEDLAFAEVLARTDEKTAMRIFADRVIATTKPTPEEYAEAAALAEARTMARVRADFEERLRGVA